MLTCVHSPIDNMRVVEEDEAERLLKTGVWFDCPNKAKAYKVKALQEIKNEEEIAKKKQSNKQVEKRK